MLHSLRSPVAWEGQEWPNFTVYSSARVKPSPRRERQVTARFRTSILVLNMKILNRGVDPKRHSQVPLPQLPYIRTSTYDF